jgi:hypothetical protein
MNNRAYSAQGVRHLTSAKSLDRMVPMTTTTQTPVEIDTKLAELYFAEDKARADLNRINDALNDAQVKQIKHGYWSCYYDATEQIKAEQALKAIIEQEIPLEAIYEIEPWNRYWHVTNKNGHIHTDQSCPSCFPTTQYGWRTDLSGLTEAEVVEREAYNACSVCMPIAPAEQKAAREYYNKQQREQRANEKQAKKDEKLKKQAIRAQKFLAKVNKVVGDTYGDGNVMAGWANLANNYSLHGHDGKKSLYGSTFDLPTQVGDYLYDQMAEMEAQARGDKHMPSRHQRDPKAIIAEATEKGLI